MRNPRTVSAKGVASPFTSEDLEALRERLRGALLLPGDSGYDESRSVWNAMIDRRPAAIVRAAGAADVIHAVELAGRHGVPPAVKGGGHNIAGNAVCDGGLMIDLSRMKSIRIDPVARTARVEPGVTLGEFDREAQAFGLATPTGINSTTGVAGLTLGGGFGWLSRKLGLTIDNLLSVDLVTAGGELLHASGTENAELFWAVRGGGGNFGIATSFEFRLHEVGPGLVSGLIVHPLAAGREILREYRRLVAAAPDELTCWAVMRKAPPLPFLPPGVHGTDVLVLALCHAGDIETGLAAVEPFRRLGSPIADAVGLNPYVGWQATFDPLLQEGFRNYWKSHDFSELGDEAIDLLVAHAGRLPTPECEIFIASLGGAISRIPADATAYPHRDIRFVVNVHTRWSEPGQDRICIAWARQFFEEMKPHATGGVYVNFMPEDEAERVGSGAYGDNFRRLSRLKARYDPDNLFRLNQNVLPAPRGSAA